MADKVVHLRRRSDGLRHQVSATDWSNPDVFGDAEKAEWEEVKSELEETKDALDAARKASKAHDDALAPPVAKPKAVSPAPAPTK